MTTATTLHPRFRRTLMALTATAALALSACGGDEPAPESESTPNTSPTASDSPSPSTSKKPKRPKETSPPASVDEVMVDVTITGNDVTPVAQQVELAVGETLLLEINADRAGELHVHSTPEQFANFEAGASKLDFTFDKPGSVDIEEHDSGALIVRVLVQ
jgi:hypothetical protein